MSDATYNGWTNYPTWCVHLWLTNEEGTQNAAAEMVNMAYGEAYDRAATSWGESEDSKQYARTMAADVLSQWVRAECDGLHENADMVSDLFGYALGQVNWHEIVRAFLEAAQ
jgi:hypothetical protein